MVDSIQSSNPEQLLAYVIALKSQLADLQGQLSESLDQLNALLEAGELDHSFSVDDWSFAWSGGKTTYTYPADIQEIEKDLKAAKAKSVADGHATKKIGAPYWTIKSPKP